MIIARITMRIMEQTQRLARGLLIQQQPSAKQFLYQGVDSYWAVDSYRGVDSYWGVDSYSTNGIS